MEDLFSGILPIIIVVVVIGLIRSAMKKKKPAGKAEDDAQAPRPPVMSDIQKAFMLMNDFDDKPRQTAKPNVVRTEGTASTQGMRGRTEGTASTQGMRGRTEGTASTQGMRGRTEGTVSTQGMRGRTEGTVSTQGMRGRTEGVVSTQGMRGRTEKVSAMKAAYSSKLKAAYGEDAPQSKENKYANVKIDKYSSHDENEQILLENARRRKSSNLKLFENKNEFVKAVIYSEILTRKTARR